MLRKRIVWSLAVVLALAGAFGLYWFAPWKLFTNTTVHDTLAVPVASAGPTGSVSTAPGKPAGPAVPVVVAQGSFVSHEHSTTGTARIVRLPDGTRQLELAQLATSDGPDLRVWLSDRPIQPGIANAY